MRRVVCTDQDPQWLQERHKRLSGTSVVAMLGHSKYKSEEDVIREKRADAPPPFETHRRVHMGQMQEDFARALWSKVTGVRTRGCNLMLENTDFPHLSCTTDGIISGHSLRRALEEERLMDQLELCCHDPEAAFEHLSNIPNYDEAGMLEIKNSDSSLWYAQREGRNGKKYRDTWGGTQSPMPPIGYWWQVQCQMLVCEKSWAVLLAKVGALGYMVYTVEKDPRAEEKIRGALEKFEREVVNKR